MFMCILGYHLHVIVYFSATIVETSDFIIKFYVITFCSRYPIQSETKEKETSPVPEDKSEMEEVPMSLLVGLTLSMS